ncbi:YkuJ family protein [Secundilactobacillus kimchicus]|uniref:DUF1797 domain-containing protein n=1 Tax=Secundilactobacillus kimchicus JCM 15530 TaxID=1302272 RepID=A0A0R1HZ95_9LACO|nr:YkuJ family protein [Secundilactobacillus kimchicus]KRK48279.1 hypothetical protein FC96_GL002019 [Secundilactobacillus kimchicus JCM 15530]MBT9670759.1 DUF1797 family protein [Secundilactobacillus kimchicus]
MTKSKLMGILNRLIAMLEDESGVEQNRRFEKDGNVACQVTLSQDKETWQLEEYQNNETFSFDDVDLVAIEVYDLLFDN